MKRRRISQERQAAYYLGMALSAVGFLTFGSVFVTGCANFGDFSNFEADVRSIAFRGVGGMALIIIGAIVSGIGARGLAGSGVVLDPEQALPLGVAGRGRGSDTVLRPAGADAVGEEVVLDESEQRDDGGELHADLRRGVSGR